MPQVTQVTDNQVIYVNDIDRVPAMFLPTFIIVIRGYAGDQHVANLIFAGATHNTRIAADALDIIMPIMVMADGDDRGIDLAQRVA